MNAILQAFGRLVCGVTGRHKWSRAHFEYLGGGVFSTVGDRFKTCRRCVEVREVKTRGKKL